MSRQTRALIYYLRRYLEKKPKRKAVLMAGQRKVSATFNKSTLWRHLTFKVQPLMTQTMIYLEFLYAEKAIRPGVRSLFVYAKPELLK